VLSDPRKGRRSKERRGRKRRRTTRRGAKRRRGGRNRRRGSKFGKGEVLEIGVEVVDKRIVDCRKYKTAKKIGSVVCERERWPIGSRPLGLGIPNKAKIRQKENNKIKHQEGFEPTTLGSEGRCATVAPLVRF
jgi:hypothetical protein